MTWSNTPLPSPADALAPRYAWVLLGVTPALHPSLVMRGARNGKGDHVWRFCDNGHEIQLKSVAQWAPASDANGASLSLVAPLPPSFGVHPLSQGRNPIAEMALSEADAKLRVSRKENDQLRDEVRRLKAELAARITFDPTSLEQADAKIRVLRDKNNQLRMTLAVIRGAVGSA